MTTTPASSPRDAAIGRNADPTPPRVGERAVTRRCQETRSSTPPGVGERALVLGGGGSTGNAWLIGVVAGLSDADLDVTAADLTVGTSAGSTAAAQLAGASPAALYAAIEAESVPASARHDQPAPSRSVGDHLERMRTILAAAVGPAELRRTMGTTALAREGSSDPGFQARWRATVAARLPGPEWPDRRVLLTAVDAHTGEPVVFDRHSGVALVDAVAASCAGGFAYRIGDRDYIDGGYRTNSDNADLAAGYARVLVLSPLSGASLHPPEWGNHLATQIDHLRAGGSRVQTIFPPAESAHLFGANAMDLSKRPVAARTGREQGKALASRLTEFWR